MALGGPIDIEFTNSDSPRHVAGQKIVAFEICELFALNVPDTIALPVSSGSNASVIWKGLRELRAAGLLDTLPRLYWVQAACDPIARAYRDSAQEVTRVESSETVAYSIGNHDPPSGTRALRAVRETGGAVVYVSENEILDATAAFATETGLCVEPASTVALAGVRTLADVGEVSDDEEVVCVATGTGFKELDHLDAGSDVRTIEREHLEEILASLT
ncbi:pyridoxal-phosphate dependent enzyme [Natrinema gelatinilyticum]|uniref:pyridoxal-phosphate dependent enzyme n=1 Tax=Natrinema gelatinilyticum TaxID=2961571 RepID=UPI0020C5A4CA|nr:pyridoxal-phosphate dependent enzyme [Natrinema gelatinilyticum]